MQLVEAYLLYPRDTFILGGLDYYSLHYLNMTFLYMSAQKYSMSAPLCSPR